MSGSGRDALLRPAAIILFSYTTVEGTSGDRESEPEEISRQQLLLLQQWPSHRANNLEPQKAEISSKRLILPLHFPRSPAVGKSPQQTLNCVHGKYSEAGNSNRFAKEMNK